MATSEDDDHPPAEAGTDPADEIRNRAWNVISEVRGRHPRLRGEAPTADIADALAAAGLLATAGTEGEAAAASPQDEAQGQGEDDPSLRQAADLMYRHVALGEVVDVDNWRRAARVLVAHANDTLRGSTDIPINAAASPRGEAQGQGESLPGPDYIEDGVEVWEAGRFTVRRDATSTISDPAVTLSGNLRPDVADPRALGLALLAAAPRAVAPVGNEHEDAKALLVEIGTEVLGLTREQVIEDPRLVRDYAAKAVGSRNMGNATLKRRAEGLRAALGAPEDTPWPQLIARVQAPVGNVERETLLRSAETEFHNRHPRARNVPTFALAVGVDVALAALRGDRETLADAFYTYLMTGSRTTAAVQAVMRDEAEQMAAVALAALRGEPR